jgi:hypothetical protein
MGRNYSPNKFLGKTLKSPLSKGIVKQIDKENPYLPLRLKYKIENSKS